MKQIKTTFLYYDKKNRNGRIYPRKIAEDIIRQFSQMNKNVNSVLGTLNPKNPGIYEELSLNDVSHRIKEIHINEEKSTVEGTLEVLETPLGMTLKTMITPERSFEDLFAVASRGIGTTDKEGRVDTYKLLGFDVIPKQESSFSIDDI